MTWTTTFTRAETRKACTDSYDKFRHFKGEHWNLDQPFPLVEVLDVCGLDDALWALRIVIDPHEREIRLLLCDYAEHVLPVYENWYPGDTRVRDRITVARRYALAQATEEELATARAAAGSARAGAEAADVAWAAARAAAGSARSARAGAEAAWAAAQAVEAAWLAGSARAAAEAADVAWAAARAAAEAADVAWAAERAWQEQRLREMLER